METIDLGEALMHLLIHVIMVINEPMKYDIVVGLIVNCLCLFLFQDTHYVVMPYIRKKV